MEKNVASASVWLTMFWTASRYLLLVNSLWSIGMHIIVGKRRAIFIIVPISISHSVFPSPFPILSSCLHFPFCLPISISHSVFPSPFPILSSCLHFPFCFSVSISGSFYPSPFSILLSHLHFLFCLPVSVSGYFSPSHLTIRSFFTLVKHDPSPSNLPPHSQGPPSDPKHTAGCLHNKHQHSTDHSTDTRKPALYALTWWWRWHPTLAVPGCSGRRRRWFWPRCCRWWGRSGVPGLRPSAPLPAPGHSPASAQSCLGPRSCSSPKRTRCPCAPGSLANMSKGKFKASSSPSI